MIGQTGNKEILQKKNFKLKINGFEQIHQLGHIPTTKFGMLQKKKGVLTLQELCPFLGH